MNSGIKNVSFKRKLFHSPVKYFANSCENQLVQENKRESVSLCALFLSSSAVQSLKKYVGCSSFIVSFKNKSISFHENTDALLKVCWWCTPLETFLASWKELLLICMAVLERINTTGIKFHFCGFFDKVNDISRQGVCWQRVLWYRLPCLKIGFSPPGRSWGEASFIRQFVFCHVSRECQGQQFLIALT